MTKRTQGDEVAADTRRDHATMHAEMETPPSVLIEGRRLVHTSGGVECVATPPMTACPCGAFPALEWSYGHL